MAVIGHRDLGEMAEALVPWLCERMPESQRIALPTPCAPAEGGSSETLFLEPVITEGGRDRRETWVLRIEATSNQIYEDPSVERQYRVMQVLAQSGTVPVPEVLWFESDRSVIGAPFFVMRRVAGEIPNSFHHSKGYLAEIVPAEREAVWSAALQTMARIDAVDVATVSFLARPELGPTGFDQEIEVWDSYAAWSEIPIRPIHERARQWLADHLPVKRPTGLAWGDARPGNMIFRKHRCVAVIDWETVSLGGAENDLGWWLFYDWFMSDGFGVPRLEGLPGRDETIRMWEGFAGRAARDMEWHEVFATWRFSLISDRARMLMRRRGEADPLAGHQETPHSRRLEMLVGS